MDIKIYGPPGTGKTTYLLGCVEQALEKYDPSQVAFVSYTRNGTYEGVTRACEKFGLTRRKLPYFKTIHALCFASLGIKKAQVFNYTHCRQFSSVVGFNFNGCYSPELKGSDDLYLFATQLAQENPEYCVRLIQDLDAAKLAYISVNYKTYKNVTGTIDYTDMLLQYLKHGKTLPVKVACIDEAQDLTPLQWRVVNKMFADCELVYLAGDDDQAIYEWAGADPRQFVARGDKTVVLDQSWRLPAKVHAFAETALKNISERAPKEYRTTGDEGEVCRLVEWRDMDINPDEATLILSRNNCWLKGASDALREKGIPFFRKNELSYDPKVIKAIHAYEAARKDPGNEGKRYRRKLYKDYFKALKKDVPWFEVLNLEADDIAYYRAMFANKVDFERQPQIRLNTIHASKGSEADHVIMCLDVTRNVHNALLKNPDSEWRCAYVGSTRAKKRLTIKLQASKYGYPL